MVCSHMNNKHLFNLSILLAAVVLAAAGVFVSLQIPRHWENHPPVCCDIANSGTNYGYPFTIKAVSCCGFAGEMQFVSYKAVAYDFGIYFLIAAAVLVPLRIFKIKKKPSSPGRT